MARKPKAYGLDGIVWFDPMRLVHRGRSFIWEDGVHTIENVEYVSNGIAYILKCGTMFTFFMPEPLVSLIYEAKIRLPPPDCRKCLE